MTERARLSVQVEPEMRDQIEQLAVDTGVKPSVVIRELLLAGLATTAGNGRPSRQRSRIVDDPFGTGDNGSR